MWSDNKVRELATMCFRGSSGQKTRYALMILACFTAVLLIYGSLFLSVFWCAIMRMLELLVKFDKSGSKIREMLVQVCGIML
jgi:hypothetical protein